MATTDYKTVGEYVAAQPRETRAVLRRVRDIIRRALPGAEEVISYQIPAYRTPAGRVIYFAGWKEHYSVYPATSGVVAAFRKELARYELSKGTIRFPLSEPVPAGLIARIAKFRRREEAERARTRDAAKVILRRETKSRARSPARLRDMTRVRR